MHHLTLPSFSIDIVTGAHLRAAELHAVGRGMMLVHACSLCGGARPRRRGGS